MRRERALKICACIGWTALLRSRLSACADGEARPCSGDDDESLRDTRRLPAARCLTLLLKVVAPSGAHKQ